MNLDSDDLLAQFRHDYPFEAEVSSLRLLTLKQAARIDEQDAEIDRLNALLPRTTTTYSAAGARPYVGSPLPDDDTGAHHG